MYLDHRKKRWGGGGEGGAAFSQACLLNERFASYRRSEKVKKHHHAGHILLHVQSIRRYAASSRKEDGATADPRPQAHDVQALRLVAGLYLVAMIQHPQPGSPCRHAVHPTPAGNLPQRGPVRGGRRPNGQLDRVAVLGHQLVRQGKGGKRRKKGHVGTPARTCAQHREAENDDDVEGGGRRGRRRRKRGRVRPRGRKIFLGSAGWDFTSPSAHSPPRLNLTGS